MKQPDPCLESLSQLTCPCGHDNALYQTCCQPLHLKTRQANTPEQLMRARYSAFALHQFDYVLNTHHGDFRGNLSLAELNAEPYPQWLRLDILETHLNPARDTEPPSGTVTFKAWYKLEQQLDAIYERSHFIFQAGQWLYTEGKQFNVRLPTRNAPCICSSGKKFKHCCGL